jgi:hypothetical protein
LHRVEQGNELALAVEIQADDRLLDGFGEPIGPVVDLVELKDGTPPPVEVWRGRIRV